LLADLAEQTQLGTGMLEPFKAIELC